MNEISIADYFMGRDKIYASDLTTQIQENAAETVRRANLLMGFFYLQNPKAHRRGVNSGWRPPAINGATKGAATKSNHMIGKAIDMGDDDEELDNWCMSPAGQKCLTDIGLWLEHPESTPRWCHIQIVPPASGNRVFRVI
jgi:hypothetical protein